MTSGNPAEALQVEAPLAETGQKKTKRMASAEFWDSYWANLQLPSVVNPDFSFDRCLCRAFKEHVPRGEGKTLLEIGCAPGRWMIWFQQQLGYAVDGLEYLPPACVKTRENLALNNVEGRVFEADFLYHDLPRASYDVVVSLGFIEHFRPAAPVIQKHVELVRPGGLLVMGIPNFRGVNYALCRLLHRDWLRVHNSRIANRRFFRGLGRRFSLDPLWIGYLGGFEPALFEIAPLPPAGDSRIAQSLSRMRQRRNAFAHRVLSRLHRDRDKSLRADFINHWMFSCYLMGVYRQCEEQEEKGEAAS